MRGGGWGRSSGWPLLPFLVVVVAVVAAAAVVVVGRVIVWNGIASLEGGKGVENRSQNWSRREGTEAESELGQSRCAGLGGPQESLLGHEGARFRYAKGGGGGD
jgi:hypothetical protein